MKAHPVTSVRTYVIVGIALLALLGLTVLAAQIDLGPFNTMVALVIAIAKALLVMLIFMDVRHSSRATWAYVGAGFFWLLILFFTIGDYVTRGWLPIGGK